MADLNHLSGRMPDIMETLLELILSLQIRIILISPYFPTHRQKVMVVGYFLIGNIMSFLKAMKR